VAQHIQDIAEIMMMAIALGMDAFSLSIGIGLNGVNRRRAFELCVWIGIFHVLFTLIGLSAGMIMEGVLGQVAQLFGAAVLIGLGLHMAYASLFGTASTAVGSVAGRVNSTGSTLLLFASGVSIDALSIGFSLGLRSVTYGLVSAAAFGVVSAVLGGVGLLIGKRVTSMAGKFGELFGAMILIGTGLAFLMD